MKLFALFWRFSRVFGGRWLTILVYAIVMGVTMTPISRAATLEEGLAAYNAKDYQAAFERLSPLAEQGNPKAQAAIGVMYDYGQGVPKDSAKAVEWYEQAAKQGISIIQHQLGQKYFQGDGIAQDYQKAAYWWQQAAESGLSESGYRLGYLYSRGWGVDKNDTLAADWYRKVADQGHGLAQSSLGVMYALGQGVDSDLSAAARWFREAAERGVPEAQYNLGVLLEHGQGTSKNLDDAKHWYQVAAEQGLEKARQKLSALGSPGQHSSQTPLALAMPATFKRESWITNQDPERYTLQIAGNSNEPALIKYLTDQKLGPDVAYLRREHNGKLQYTAVYGVFDSRESARQASLKLPDTVQKSKPWVRKFSDLQAIVAP